MGTKKVAEQCSGQKILKPKPGLELHLDISKLTDDQFNDLFEHVEEAHMCLKAHNTNIEEMNFPMLTKLLSCDDGELFLSILS